MPEFDTAHLIKETLESEGRAQSARRAANERRDALAARFTREIATILTVYDNEGDGPYLYRGVDVVVSASPSAVEATLFIRSLADRLTGETIAPTFGFRVDEVRLFGPLRRILSGWKSRYSQLRVKAHLPQEFDPFDDCIEI